MTFLDLLAKALSGSMIVVNLALAMPERRARMPEGWFDCRNGLGYSYAMRRFDDQLAGA
jgi:hypothetical protein